MRPIALDLFAAIRARSGSHECCAAGIDLGTTNSAVSIASVAANGSITVECVRDGAHGDASAPIAIPTVVAITDNGLTVGREARRLLAERIESAHGKTVFAETKGRLQDRERAEQCYRRAIEIEPSSAPIFNLALARRDSGDLAEALTCVERAMAAGPSEPCHRILKADLLRRAGQIENSDRLLREIAAERKPLAELTDWQLSWFDFAASMKGDTAWQARLATEKARRKVKVDEPRVGVLPRRV